MSASRNDIVFLDIDGVLNSVRYDRERTAGEGNIDESRMPLLQALLAACPARIVLSSSWRKHWGPTPCECDGIGEELNLLFAKYGLKIFDKTPVLETHGRAREIGAWLLAHAAEVDRFVILDDEFGGWGELSERLVRTNPRIGRGLEERHVQEAILLLTRERNEA